MLKSKHKFIGKYPIDPKSEKLILGTIHPHDHGKFKTEFFYGNSNALWLLLSDAFPKELKKPVSLDGILQFLRNRKISISDTIIECERPAGSTSDHELKVLKLNHALITAIKDSKINMIYFTSGFGKNNAFKLFY